MYDVCPLGVIFEAATYGTMNVLCPCKELIFGIKLNSRNYLMILIRQYRLVGQ